MKMLRSGWIGLAAVQLVISVARADGPLPAPRRYVTPNYGLTFSTPAGSSYCPLPEGWVGSDHGTTVFLDRPEACGGAGYPSIDRGFSAALTPRIEVFYAHWMGEDEPAPPHCNVDGWAILMEQRRAICRRQRDGMITEDIRARYGAGGNNQVIVTLVTTQAKRERGIAALRALTATMRNCARRFKYSAGKSGVVGIGRPCPAGGCF